MQIDVKGAEWLLEQISLYVQDGLLKRGFVEGPKYGSIVDYVRNDVIISIERTAESEGRDCTLHLESEQELPELNEVWDEALAALGTDVMHHLIRFAVDSKKVSAELKK